MGTRPELKIRIETEEYIYQSKRDQPSALVHARGYTSVAMTTVSAFATSPSDISRMDELSTLKRISAMSSPFIDIAATSQPVVQPPSTDDAVGPHEGRTVRDRTDRCVPHHDGGQIFDEDFDGVQQPEEGVRLAPGGPQPARISDLLEGGRSLEISGPKRSGAVQRG